MRMIVTDAKVVDPDNIRMIHICDRFVFLQEAVKCTNTVTVLRHLPQHLHYNLQMC